MRISRVSTVGHIVTIRLFQTLFQHLSRRSLGTLPLIAIACEPSMDKSYAEKFRIQLNSQVIRMFSEMH